MAFFSSSMVHDSQLRRKRSSSTTRERPPRPSTSTSSDGHSGNRFTSSPISLTESYESIPPLPSGTHLAATVLATPTAYEFSSTPLSITKNRKRESPPPFSNLMVNFPADNITSSPTTASTSTSKPANPSPVVPTKGLPTRSSSLRRAARLEIQPPRLQSSAEIEQSSPFVPILPSSGKSVSPADKTSLKQKAHSHTGSLNNSSSSSSPVTPMLFAPSHSSSPGHSPTSRSFSSGKGSSRSSFKRTLLSACNSVEQLAFSGLSSPQMSNKGIPSRQLTSPTQTGSSHQKRPRNVLRKPSVQAHREQATPDKDKDESSSKNSRPRAKSVTISPTRSGAMFDISQPLPTKGLNLTPAGAIQAAYQESQRRSGSTYASSGRVVAIGTPDHGDARGKKSQIGHRNTDDPAMDTPVPKGVDGVRNVLARKLSARWGKTTERREERFHTASASVTGLPDSFIHSPSKTSVSGQIDALVSPRRRELELPREQVSMGYGDGSQGRVWEDTVDDWVINRQGDLSKKDIEGKEKSPVKDMSNPQRLWKLVKRLSSGNLKDRRQSSTEDVPPVPPLPKDLTRGSVDHQDDNDISMMRSPIPEPSKGLMRYISSIPSLTIPPPSQSISTTTTKWSTPSEIGPTSSSPRSQTGAGPRRLRSETTRSSSPSSGTTGFFSRSRSSSTSSYGETLPPMPDMPLAHNTLKHSPQPLTAPDSVERNARYTARSHSKSPPRRKSHDTSPAGSATIPFFDVQNPINKFLISKGKRTQYTPLSLPIAGPDRERIRLVRRPSTANASSSTPPVPPRSPKRPSTSNGSAPTTGNTRKFSVPNVVHAGDDQRPKLRPRSVSDGIVESSASMTFREMTSLKQPLSEAEKAAKWEDLLNRSAKAGGTLHVVPRTDSSMLWSENRSFTSTD